MGCFDQNNTDKFVSRMQEYLNKPKYWKIGWVPTILMQSDEQWDKPNAWLPLQYITIMSLDSTSNKDAKILASKIVEKWICTNFFAYNSTNKMYEKYTTLI